MPPLFPFVSPYAIQWKGTNNNARTRRISGPPLGIFVLRLPPVSQLSLGWGEQEIQRNRGNEPETTRRRCAAAIMVWEHSGHGFTKLYGRTRGWDLMERPGSCSACLASEAFLGPASHGARSSVPPLQLSPRMAQMWPSRCKFRKNRDQL